MNEFKQSAQAASGLIRTISAVILDTRGRVLLVRKVGSEIFIQPGGKPEPGETPLETLARELEEELGVRMNHADARCLGRFEDVAVHEAGHRIKTETWLVKVTGEPVAQAEIAELRWIDPSGPYPVKIAPLSRKHILPALCKRCSPCPIPSAT
jgi:8-oxo-dGTP diphosphatase